ncbi:hypothetical protein DENSPDRAFT_111346 [Dentipellis sp. KUC8613]|nr:hypothetical protein DENSPDRAFT_111346 [Dentipellis sp. KUC8613]
MILGVCSSLSCCTLCFCYRFMGFLHWVDCTICCGQLIYSCLIASKGYKLGQVEAQALKPNLTRSGTVENDTRSAEIGCLYRAL